VPAKRVKEGFTEDERAAVRERAKELRAKSRPGKEDGEAIVLAKIATLPPPDRTLATQLHSIVRATAPDLKPRTWYGMPAYAKEDEILCWFQPASKFKARYAMLGFSDEARLDEGNMWPISFALARLTAAEEARIVALLRKAIG